MKKITLTLLFLLCACPVFAQQEAFQWQITVLDAKVATSLDSTSVITEYGGSQTPVANNNQSAAGNVYLLLELDLHKASTGGSGFDWEDTHLQDSAGNIYTRLENDTFLRTHGFDRLQSTKIQLSTNGWVCYEIPESALIDELFFVHNSEQGENSILIEKEE